MLIKHNTTKDTVVLIRWLQLMRNKKKYHFVDSD